MTGGVSVQDCVEQVVEMLAEKVVYTISYGGEGGKGESVGVHVYE